MRAAGRRIVHDAQRNDALIRSRKAPCGSDAEPLLECRISNVGWRDWRPRAKPNVARGPRFRSDAVSLPTDARGSVALPPAGALCRHGEETSDQTPTGQHELRVPRHPVRLGIAARQYVGGV